MNKPCSFNGKSGSVALTLDASEVEAIERIKMDVYEGEEEIPNGFWRKFWGLPTEKRMKTSMQDCTKVTMKSGHKYYFFDRDGYTFEEVSRKLNVAMQ